jgi:copper oxidase (laccase) domain-containing protein
MRFLSHLNIEKYPLYLSKSFEKVFLPKIVTLNFDPFASGENNIPIPFHGLKSAVSYSLNEPLSETFTLKPFHSNVIARASENSPNADAHYIIAPFSNLSSIFQGKEHMAILTADCLAVVFSFENNSYFFGALSHAGWRGYSSGILQNTIEKLRHESCLLGISSLEFMGSLKVHISPAIFGVSYECGENVNEAIIQHGKSLFAKYPEMKHCSDLFYELINVRNDQVLCAEIDKFLLQNQQSYYFSGKIFPDLQLLAALECFISGVQLENIEILRENTYAHPALFSFRQMTHKNIDKSNRQWTHLHFPKVER